LALAAAVAVAVAVAAPRRSARNPTSDVERADSGREDAPNAGTFLPKNVVIAPKFGKKVDHGVIGTSSVDGAARNWHLAPAGISVRMAAMGWLTAFLYRIFIGGV
jgi:hypothetical protein